MRGFFSRYAIIVAGLLIFALADVAQAGPDPVVTITKSKVVSIGEDFTLTVTFANAGDVGFGPYVDLFLPAVGIDGQANMPSGLPGPCDGITFNSAVAHFSSPTVYPLTPTGPTHSIIIPATFNCANAATVGGIAGIGGPIAGIGPVTNISVHPFAGLGATLPPLLLVGGTSIAAPAGYELVVLQLPFTSYYKTQGPVSIEVNLHLSDAADAGQVLSVYARGGFQFNSVNAIPNTIVQGPLAFVDITPNVFTLTKDCIQNGVPCPEDETVTGPSFPFDYAIAADVGTGLNVNDLTLNDCLDDNLQYVGAGVSGQIPGSVSTNPVSPQIDATPGGCVDATFPGPITGEPGPDATLGIQVYIPEFHPDGTAVLTDDCGFQQGVNHVDGSAMWTPLDPRDAAAPVLGSAEDVIIKKCLAVQKTVSPTVAIPGTILNYTVNFQVSDYFTIGNLALTDLLSDGQSFIPSSVVLTVAGQSIPVAAPFVTATSQCNPMTPWGTPGFEPFPWLTPPTGFGPPEIGTVIGFDLSGAMAAAGGSWSNILLPGTTGTITFQTQVTNLYACPVAGSGFVNMFDRMFNYLTINGDVLDNVTQDPNVPIGHATDDSGTQVDIVGDSIRKCVYGIERPGSSLPILAAPGYCAPFNAVPSPLPLVAPGDQITFRILKDLPASDWENLTVEDFLTYPLLPLSPANVVLNWGPANTCGPAATPPTSLPPAGPSATNSSLFDFGINDSTANVPCTIDILVTATVSSDLFPDGLVRNNQATQCGNNSFGEMICQNAVAPFRLGEPVLRIRKGAISVCQPQAEGCYPPDPSLATFAPSTVGLTGVTLPGSPGLRFNSLLTSSASVTSNVIVDGGDLVTFATVVENTGSSPTGAFDVKIKDLPPTGFGFANLFVSDGAGSFFDCDPSSVISLVAGAGAGCAANVTDFFAGGIFLNDLTGPSAADFGGLDRFGATGANIAIATYDMKVPSDVVLGKCFDNKTELLNYAGIEGGMNHVDPIHPKTDVATVCIRKPSITKSIVPTSEAHTPNTGGVEQLAIGEIVRYRLKIALPEGSAPSFTVADNLPAGMGFLDDGTAKIAVISDNAGIVAAAVPPAGFVTGNETSVAAITPVVALPTLPGNIATARSCLDPTLTGPFAFTLGDVTNTDADANQEFIVVEFNAQVCNVAANIVGKPLPNKAEVLIDTNGDNQPDSIGVSSTVASVVVEPKVQIAKSVVPGREPYTYTYTLSLTNTGNADAFELVVEDPLTLACRSSLLQIQLPSGPNVMQNTLSAGIGVNIGVLAAGATVDIIYTVALDRDCNPEKSCPVKNEAVVTWTSLPGAQGTQPNLTGSSVQGTSGAPNGERNGSTAYAPNPPNSPDLPNNYHAAASANLCGQLCVVKLNAANGLPLSGWDIVVNGPTQQFSLTTDATNAGPTCVPQFIGDYSLTETAQPNWTPAGPTTQTATVVPNQASEVTFVNKPVSIELTIRKKVGAGANAPPSFDANVPIFPFTLNCTSTGLLPSFTLSNGGGHTQSVLITDACTLAESLPANWPTPKNCRWVVTYAGGQGFMPPGPVQISVPPGTSNVDVKNTLVCEPVDDGWLTIQKKVDNQTLADLSGWNYPFNVSCEGNTVEDFDLPQQNGAMDYTVSNIPYGADCKVVEGPIAVPHPLKACPRGGEPVWTTTYYPGGQSSPGYVHAGDVVTVVNTLTCEKDVGSITVIKRVKAAHGTDLTGVQYPFYVGCEGMPAATFSLPNSGSWQDTVNNIPNAADCKVGEDAPIVPDSVKLCPEGGVPIWSQEISPPANGDYYHAGETVTATNILTCEKPVDDGWLTIQKKVDNQTSANLSGWNYPFNVSCEGNTGEAFDLPQQNGAMDYTVNNIPYGADCKVVEGDIAVPDGRKACPRGGDPVWTTTYYPGGQSSPGYVHAGDVVTVVNTLTCETDVGSLTVIKLVRATDETDLTGVEYPFHVSCEGMPDATFNLPNSGSWQQEINNIPNAADCKVGESTPIVPTSVKLCPDGGVPSWSQEITPPENGDYYRAGETVIAVNTLICEKRSTEISLFKTIKDNSQAWVNGPTFPVTLNCGGTPQVADLSAGGGPVTVGNLPIGSTCTITETPPPPPANCRWNTMLRWDQINHPNGSQIANLQGPVDPRTVEVINILDCGSGGAPARLNVTKTCGVYSDLGPYSYVQCTITVTATGTPLPPYIAINEILVGAASAPAGLSSVTSTDPWSCPTGTVGMNTAVQCVIQGSQFPTSGVSTLTAMVMVSNDMTVGEADNCVDAFAADTTGTTLASPPQTAQVCAPLGFVQSAGSQAALVVTKTCDPLVPGTAAALPHALCTITVTQTGTPIPQTITLTEALNELIMMPPSAGQIANMTSAQPWSFPTLPANSNTPVTLQISGADLAAAGGQSVITVEVDFSVPEMASEYENCVDATGTDAAGQVTLTALQVCAPFKGTEPARILTDDVKISGPGESLNLSAPTVSCRGDEASQTYVCDVGLDLTNIGEADFMGPMALTYTMLSPPAPDALTAGWACSQPDGSTSCVNGNLELPSGMSTEFQVEMRISALDVDGSFETCATIGLENTESAAVLAVQSVLMASGIDIGPIDGKMGKKTRKAVKQLQKDFGLKQTGEIDEELLMQLAIPLAQDEAPSCVLVDLPPLAKADLKCPEGTQLLDGACMKPESAATICDGGQITGGECICPEGSKVQQFADNAFACLQPEPTTIICEGGKVQDGKCNCPEGADLQQTGDTAFVCLKQDIQEDILDPIPSPTPDPEPAVIICDGGKVQDGKCNCPEGADLQQIGDTAFVCLKQDIQGQILDPIPSPTPEP